MVVECSSEPGVAPSAQGTVRTTFADIPGVLARGAAIAADAAEHRGAVFAADQTRYFLRDLPHPDSALGVAIVGGGVGGRGSSARVVFPKNYDSGAGVC